MKTWQTIPLVLGLLYLTGCAAAPPLPSADQAGTSSAEGKPGAAPTTSAPSELPDLGAAPTTSALSELPDLGAAPELHNEVWLQEGELLSAPLRLADLRGKVVLLDMWTFG